MKYILIILILFSSCTTQKRCTEKFPPPTPSTDSIYVETIEKIPVYLPGDTVKFETIIKDCSDQDVIIYENGTLKQTIKILNGKLYSALQIKPDTIRVSVIKTKEVYKESKQLPPVKYIPKFWLVMGWIGIGFTILLVAYFVLKIAFRK